MPKKKSAHENRGLYLPEPFHTFKDGVCTHCNLTVAEIRADSINVPYPNPDGTWAKFHLPERFHFWKDGVCVTCKATIADVRANSYWIPGIDEWPVGPSGEGRGACQEVR
jgi:hypothetical protein